MIGFFVALVASWVLLRLVLHEPFSVLGLTPSWRRGRELLAGFAFMAGLGVLNFLWQAHFKEIGYRANPDYGLGQALGGAWLILQGVLFEELTFRGVLLVLLIRKLGVLRACLISAVAFGIYHWFSYEVFGERLILMAYIFLVTGAGGWMFAVAFARTGSLYAPIGLHLGWNLVAAVVFSAGPLGEQWWLPVGEPVVTSDWVTLLFFCLQAVFAPGLVTWVLHRRRRSVAAGSNADPATAG